MPSSIYLVTGGARSGKSSYAERLCESLCDNPIYLATATNPGVKDADFAERIQRHQEDRKNKNWTTIEEPLHPSQHAETFSKGVVLVDCLTLWLTNYMAEEGAFSTMTGGRTCGEEAESDNNDDQQISRISDAADRALDKIKAEFDELTAPWDVTFVFVTNELGSGTHGDAHSTRKFVDAQGRFNQYVASKAQRVVHTVCGIPNVLKNTLDDNLRDDGKSTTPKSLARGRDQAQLVDKFLSSRSSPMDSKGYFLVCLDRTTSSSPSPNPAGVIVASFHSCMVNDEGEVCDLQGKKIPCCGDDAKKNRPEPMKVWKCRTAKELTTEIFERWEALADVGLSVGHAAYIGREAQKAEQCLYSGEPYQQD